MAEEYSVNVPITELRIGFGRRFGAILIDAIIITLLSALIYFLTHDTFENILEPYLAHQLSEQTQSLFESSDEQIDYIMGFTRAGIIWGFTVALVALLYSLMEIAYAATPGKMMLGIKIANADGTEAPTRRLTTRWFVKTGLSTSLSLLGMLTVSSLLSSLSTVISIVIGLGCFMALSATRQALHDRIAQTAVFRREHIQSSSEQQA